MVGAVIYVRVSTKEQTENLSLPTQLRACEEYCPRQGYEILERFHEEGEGVFLPPIGYLNAPRATGKSLMHDPKRAPLVHRAFEAYAPAASRRSNSSRRLGPGGSRTDAADQITSQAIGMLLRNQLYAGIVDGPEYGVRGQRGDFERLISDPDVRSTRPAARRRPLGAGIAQRQRFQQLFFPEGIAFRWKTLYSNRRNCPGLQLLQEIRTENEGLVDQTGIEPVTS